MTHVFEQLHNFRDLGGLRTRDGRHTRRGVLFRSDSLHSASATDIQSIAANLKMTSVIDLRSETELATDGIHPAMPKSVQHLNMPLPGGPGGAMEVEASDLMLVVRYLEYLDQHASSIVGAVQSLVEPNGVPAVVHCRLGKDRTGTFVAVVLSAVGVLPEEIAADYALTKPAMTKILEELRASPQYAANVKRLPPQMYGSEPVTMMEFLRKLEALHGGAARWLTDNGLPRESLLELQQLLV